MAQTNKPICDSKETNLSGVSECAEKNKWNGKKSLSSFWTWSSELIVILSFQMNTTQWYDKVKICSLVTILCWSHRPNWTDRQESILVSIYCWFRNPNENQTEFVRTEFTWYASEAIRNFGRTHFKRILNRILTENIYRWIIHWRIQSLIIRRFLWNLHYPAII